MVDTVRTRSGLDEALTSQKKLWFQAPSWKRLGGFHRCKEGGPPSDGEHG